MLDHAGLLYALRSARLGASLAFGAWSLQNRECGTDAALHRGSAHVLGGSLGIPAL